MAHPYGLDPKGADLAASAASLARDVASQRAQEVDTSARFPRESLDALGHQGLLGLCVPTELGGKGQGPGTFAAVVEELAQGCASTAMVYVMHVTAAQAIAASTSLANREALLRDIAAGKHLTTLAFSEKGSRSQFWAPVSRLERRVGGYTTDAQKSWVTSASHADSYVSTGLSPDAKSALESTLYLVRRGAKGVKVEGGFDGLGLRGNDSAPVTFKGVDIVDGDLVTPLGQGADTILSVVLPWFVVGTSAMANGLCRAAVDATTRHLTTTGFEHTGLKLRDLPNLRTRLANMSVRTEQSRSLLGRAVGAMEAPDAMTPVLVLQTRHAALEAALAVTDLAMKACGGAAFSKHLGIERLFRDARAGWVMAPTVDHLEDFIGRALTGLELF